MTRVMRQDVDAALPPGWPHVPTPIDQLPGVDIDRVHRHDELRARRCDLERQLRDLDRAIDLKTRVLMASLA